MPQPILPHSTVTERIVLGPDSLPNPLPASNANATLGHRKTNETYQQMFRIVDDLREMREQRNEALHALRAAQRDAIRRLTLISARREAGGLEHCLRVGALSALLGAALGKPLEWCDRLFDAASVHDIGNFSIPDGVLYKTGRLSAQEWRIVRDHPIAGAALLTSPNNPIEALAAEAALNHHENWDGSGYPAGRLGSNIPLSGRIVAVADFVDSIGSASSYRDALPAEDILHLLSISSGAKFDPYVVGAMVELRPCLYTVRRYAAEWAPKYATATEYPLWWSEV